MLRFEFELTDHRQEFHKEKHSYIFEYEGFLTIHVGDVLFFEEQIAILEFFRDTTNWRKEQIKSKSMLFNCIETDDNPLISFVENNGKWLIHSTQQKFECHYQFTRETLETAILELEHSVDYYISRNR